MSEIKTEHEMQMEFQKKFHKEILPFIEQEESERISYLLKLGRIAYVPTLVLLAIAFLFLFIAPAIAAFFAIFALHCLIFGVIICCYFAIKDYSSAIKNKILPIVCSAIGNFKYKYYFYKDKNIFKKSNLLDFYDFDDFDDIFYGEVDGVNIEIVEGSLFNAPRMSRHKRIFKGILVKLDMNKTFNGNTVVRPESILKKSPKKKLKLTTLEDVEFEKKFDVFTDDEVEARYLITTSFMERLNKIKTVFSANKVACAFYKENILIALYTNKDIFHITSAFQTLLNRKMYFEIFDEFSSIVKLIEHFKLNQKIGL